MIIIATNAYYMLGIAQANQNQSQPLIQVKK